MTEELSPARQALLLQAVNVQERMLNGCEEVFSGLRQSSDPEAALYAQQALDALKNTRDTLEAMIDGFHATKH